jgi:hypothetical protein
MTTQRQPIYGKNILHAVGRCPIILEKLNLFSKPVEMEPLRESTVLNLTAFAKAFEKESALASHTTVSAASVTQKLAFLDPWMQARIRDSITLPFQQSLCEPIIRLVLNVLVADGLRFPATDIHILSPHESDKFHCAGETLNGIRHAITNLWRLENPRDGFIESPWTAEIEAEAQQREHPGVEGFDDEPGAPAITRDQAMRMFRDELVTDPLKRMELGIVHAVGLEDPALSLFAWRAANSCQAVFCAWVTFLLASLGTAGCERWCVLFERLIDDFAAGNFLVGIDQFTLLVA